MAGVFQAPNLISANGNYTYQGAGKSQTGNFARSWDGVFGAAAASSQGNAYRYDTNSDFAAQIWNPSEFGATSRQGLAAASGIGETGVMGLAQTKSAKIEADAMKRQGSGWGQVIGGALGLASRFIPTPK